MLYLCKMNLSIFLFRSFFKSATRDNRRSFLNLSNSYTIILDDLWNLGLYYDIFRPYITYILVELYLPIALISLRERASCSKIFTFPSRKKENLTTHNVNRL